MDPSQLENEDIDRLQKLYRMCSSPTANKHEAASARKMLDRLLAQLGLDDSDMPAIMAIDVESRQKSYNVLLLLEGLISKYIWIPPEETVTVALWILHTYVFSRYTFTARLALSSPVFGCGKTTLITLIQQLAYNPSQRFNNLTPALIYQLIDARGPQTLLIDEANNANILQNPTLRSVLNSNRRGDVIGRGSGRQGMPRVYQTFTPMVIAGKGRLPNDLVQRSIIINLHRHPSNLPPLEQLNEFDVDFQFAMRLLREEIHAWVHGCRLAPNPKTPLRNRYADNWRPLLAIADSLGHGKRARMAAEKTCAGLPDDDVRVLLLEDIRDIFDDLGVDRIWTADLLAQLHAFGNGMWSEWCGENNDRSPHKLSAYEFARMLHDFKISPTTIHQLGGRDSRGRGRKGYYRRDLESAWASYCSPGPPDHRTTSLNLRLVNNNDTEEEA
jgi:hypothetical protein